MIQALVAALVLALAAAGWQTWRLDAAQDEIKAERAAAVAVALAHAENARALETTWVGKVNDAQRRRETELQASRRAADALRTERDGLRGDIATYAAGCADDSPAACRDRAATLGQLLDRALQAAERSTGAAEEHAADVRTLLNSWPVRPPK